jgi:hypothetical protein
MARRTRLVIRGEAPAVEFRDIAIDVAASMQLSFCRANVEECWVGPSERSDSESAR